MPSKGLRILPTASPPPPQWRDPAVGREHIPDWTAHEAQCSVLMVLRQLVQQEDAPFFIQRPFYHRIVT